MKKFILSFVVFISGAWMFASCNLISSAGFNSKGLPTPDVTAELRNSGEGVQNKVDHGIWNGLLQRHVDKDGMVNYSGFKKDREKLDEYLKLLSSKKPDDSWKTSELLAYYINLYNAYTVDLILRNYPVKSIKDIDGAWTREFVKVGDTEISLGGIENSLLRKMNEPRIHFAINCASISCPKLLNEAYTAGKIESQLDKVTREFINSDKNVISKNAVKLSKIFDWYKGDFTENGRSLIDYINQYSETRIDPDAKVSFREYNWELNDSK
ncbi:DUF547 domain-containing protein [Pontixanthobacter gangjinensis]|uniref:DUF547 domain-containing protein n=1 Tax=Christiangramia aestuarii TaxID=1028746 RepID=A0A7K1LNH3_9FLAO|nr:DUF547 domain-containing protein [Christiangramia aestuarii]MUP42354.1 DUF547 domain-containing protein [Christiangramia aestuarii]